MSFMSCIIILICWVVPGLLGAGFLNAYMTEEYCMIDSPKERRIDQALSILCGLLGGPICFIMGAVHGYIGQHGWFLTQRGPSKKKT